MKRATASATRRSVAAGPILCANAATWASTKEAASRVRVMVASAIRRALHTGRSPSRMRVQWRGRRYLSSRAAQMRVRPESVEMPRVAASSGMQNSATKGAPGPASGMPVSVPPPNPAVVQVAASAMDSTGCCSAHVTAATRMSASARSARRVGPADAGEGEHVTGSVELLESGRFPCLHEESQPATTDKNPAGTDGSAGCWTRLFAGWPSGLEPFETLAELAPQPSRWTTPCGPA